MDKSEGLPVRKRLLDHRLRFEQQIIEYAKKSILSAKIILDEDFDAILDSPNIQLEPVPQKTQAGVKYALSAVSIAILHKLEAKWYYFPIAIIPAMHQAYTSIRKYTMKQSMCRRINRFIKALGYQASLNGRVLKHLRTRNKSLNELSGKINLAVMEIIQEDDAEFAHQCALALYELCVVVQNGLILQSEYSGPNYAFIGNWKLETFAGNESIGESIKFIERLSEMYVLLASNLLSSTIFALENAMWKSSSHFLIAFDTIPTIHKAFKKSISTIRNKMKKTYYNFKPIDYQPIKTHSLMEKHSVYKESIYEIRDKLGLLANLANSMKSQDSKTRCILLEEMLNHHEQLQPIIRDLLLYERSKGGYKQSNTLKSLPDANTKEDKTENPKIINGNDSKEEVPSDDEVYECSPRESDDDGNQAHANGVNYEEDTAEAAAIQRLMLHELQNRMQDVRRIKITRTADGNLLVQERPITLQESGGQVNVTTNVNEESQNSSTNLEETNVYIDDHDDYEDFKFKPFCIPPIPVPTLCLQSDGESDSENIHIPVMSKEFLANIRTMAKQRAQQEDTFDYVGEDYVESDDDDKE